MRYPTRAYQCDPPSTLLLRRLRKFMRRCNNPEPNIAIDTQSHINTNEPRS
jgi:hypothetical protein